MKSKLPDILQKENMDFIEWFTREHWTLEKPLLQIHKETGIARTTLKRQADNHGLKIRSISDDNKRRYKNMTEEQIKAQTAAANDKVRKEGHPTKKGKPAAWTQDEEKRKIIGAKISAYKRKHNPMHEGEWNIKQSAALALYLRENISDHEKAIKEVLQQHGVDFIHQYQIDTFIGDFYIKSCNLIIELDNLYKMDNSRKERMKQRDEYIKSKGFNIVHIDKFVALKHPEVVLQYI